MKYNNQKEYDDIAIHIIIIWSNASIQKDRIISDIKQDFDIIKLFNVHWEKKLFLDNLKVFYAHSQKKLSSTALISLMENKMKHCGDKDFHVVVFRDNSPIYENRDTSSGVSLVNSRVFDKKQLYRQWTGGGHKIHCSNDAWETNKDLTLLFGLNTEDFCLRYGKKRSENSLMEENVSHNCIGVNGYDDIRQLFYVLNNSVQYVVLRNHECLPEHYTAEGHGDIDLLVENFNYIKHLTSAYDVYRSPYRVYHTIKVGGKQIPFDFRHVGDNYYDIEWEKSILKNRKFQSKGFYTPNDKDQFYSLLYHAFIQKPSVAEDYIRKLNNYSKRIGIEFNTSRVEDAVGLLDSFFEEMQYEYVRPNDKTVFFNKESLKKSNYAYRHGRVVSKYCHDENRKVPFVSVVYEKDNSYYKRGSDFLINNECRFLKEIKDFDCFPVLMKSGVNQDGAYLETQKIEGYNFDAFFSKPENITYEIISSFIKAVLQILRIFVEKKIIHRDFIGQNFIIQKTDNVCKVYLIDFGWAIFKNEYNTSLSPNGLGSVYAPQNGISDFYTFASTLRKRWPKVHYVTDICDQMEQNIFQGTDDTKECLQILFNVEKLVNKSLSYGDMYILFEQQHQRLHQIRYRLLLKFRCFENLFRFSTKIIGTRLRYMFS